MRTMAGRMLQVVFSALLFASCLRGAIGGSQYPPPIVKTLIYYVFESYAGANISVVPIAGQNNNLTFRGFGLTSAIDNIITLSTNSSDTVVGAARGFGTTAKDPNLNHFTSTHSFNDSKALGIGSLELLGELDLAFPLKPSEVVVLGGTGDYRFLRGVATILPVYFGTNAHTYLVNVSLVL